MTSTCDTQHEVLKSLKFFKQRREGRRAHNAAVYGAAAKGAAWGRRQPRLGAVHHAAAASILGRVVN
jgi:hypothetical protein